MLDLSGQQSASNHEQVRQRASHPHAVKVFRQAPIPNFRESKQSFDDPEGVLNSGADLRLSPVFEPLGLIDLTVVAIALIDEVLRLLGALANHIPLAAVRLISVHLSLLSVQQVRQRQGIGNIRRGDLDDPLFPIHSDVGLHPEIPLFSLGRLMHLRIPLPALVLRRRGRADDLASTIVPRLTLIPWSCRCRFTALNTPRPACVSPEDGGICTPSSHQALARNPDRCARSCASQTRRTVTPTAPPAPFPPELCATRRLAVLLKPCQRLLCHSDAPATVKSYHARFQIGYFRVALEATGRCNPNAVVPHTYL